jgi:hypothetical protein
LRRSFLAALSRLRADLAFTCLFAVLAIVHLLPLLAARHLPFQDQPAHLAVVEAWRNVDASNLLGAYYAPGKALSPYITYYGSLRLLGVILPLEIANHLILIGYVLALPLAFTYTVTRFGRDRRYGLLGFAFVYNTPLVFGFVSNALAIPLFVLLLGLIKDYLDRPKILKELLLAVLVVALYFTHVLVFVAFACAAPVIFFGQTWRPLAILRRCLFMLPAMGVAIYWSVTTAGKKGLDGEYYDIAKTLAQFPYWINNVLVGPADEIALLGVGASWLICLVLRPTLEELPRAFWSLAVSALPVIVALILLPAHARSPDYHWATNVRLVLPAALLLLSVPLANLRRWRLLALVPAFAGMLWGAGHVFVAFRDFDRTVRPLDEVLQALPYDQRVLGLVYEPKDSLVTGYPLRHVLLLAQVRKRAFMPHSFADDYTPISREKPVTAAFEYSRPKDFSYRVHGRHYHYFLVIAAPNHEPGPTFPGAGGDVRLVTRRGRFGLYENIGALRPK